MSKENTRSDWWRDISKESSKPIKLIESSKTETVLDRIKRKKSSTKNRKYIKQLWEKESNRRCTYCFCELIIEEATLEHLRPLSKGGDYSIENLAIACGDCNNEKGDLTELEYRNFRRRRVFIDKKRANGELRRFNSLMIKEFRKTLVS